MRRERRRGVASAIRRTSRRTSSTSSALRSAKAVVPSRSVPDATARVPSRSGPSSPPADGAAEPSGAGASSGRPCGGCPGRGGRTRGSDPMAGGAVGSPRLSAGSEPRVRPPRPGQPPQGRPLDAPAPDGSAAPSAGGEDGPEREGTLAVASGTERLGTTAFADLSADEVDEVRRLVRRIALATPLRRSRRTTPTRRSGARVDLRRTLRAAQRSGGDPVRLLHREPRLRARRLVLLCDVSASMEPYTRVFLSLLQGAVSGVHAEAFVFSTRLTRRTRHLAGRDPDLALAAAAAAAPDWGCVRDHRPRRPACSVPRRARPAPGWPAAAVGSALSDGWAQDEPADVAAQMARRLHRLAHRVVWVNPRKAAPASPRWSGAWRRHCRTATPS